jgi:hypothetical protein
MPKKYADESQQEAEKSKAKTFDVKKISELVDKEEFQDKGKEQEPNFLL